MQVVSAFCGGAQAEIEKCNVLAFSFSSVLHVVIVFCSWTLEKDTSNSTLSAASSVAVPTFSAKVRYRAQGLKPDARYRHHVYIYICIEMLIDIYIYTDTHTSVYVFIYP